MKKNFNGRMKIRIAIVMVFFVAAFGVIFLRAFYLQVAIGGSLQERAFRQHTRTVKVPPNRGTIYDRNLEELAMSVEVDSVFAQPRNVKDAFAASKTLAPLLSVERRRLSRKMGSEANFVWLRRQVDLNDAQRAKIQKLPGIGMHKEKRRYYPVKSLAANLVGFAGVDSDGLEGVELYYDKYLKGAQATVRAGKDARGKLLLYEDMDEAVRGMDVILTIDKTIQYIAEKALQKSLLSTGARSGVVIVMDPHTGEVLAMANAPTFDPNEFTRFKPGQWRNRAITDTFEPGSTIKAFLLASVVEEGLLGPNDIFFCENGKYKVADRIFHDTKEHGWLSVKNILKLSSNIGAAKMGETIGGKKYYSYLKSVGFGDRTGIELPGESRGLLRNQSRWSGVTLHTVSFGQGMSVTPLQLASAFSALANGGYLMEPRIVKRIKNSGGDVLKETSPVVVRRAVSEETARVVTDVLTSVTEAGGTGELALPGNGFKVAGKTGTAQKPDLIKGGYAKGKYVSSFVGYLPARDPRLTILVVIDEPVGVRVGGLIAAPVFSEIARETLAYMGVFPEGKEGKGGKEGKRRGEKFDNYGIEIIQVNARGKLGGRQNDSGDPLKVPDFSGKTMRSVLRVAGKRAFDVSVVGSGRAVSQKPEAGKMLPDTGAVTVVFQ